MNDTQGNTSSHLAHAVQVSLMLAAYSSVHWINLFLFLDCGEDDMIRIGFAAKDAEFIGGEEFVRVGKEEGEKVE
jgi:hypothetical protein